ncbi:Hydrolase, alpha/beta fold family functionally coupled to Phosphoribulokinase [Acidisarcina polymorpha]|uniref:Hydrolase, alpha/beta fold family functionally coupled to Phosphoribulokinase n=1 Tax=Acidisarcina polymorpha TaxID=2211140 RepID=A0A2Z5G0D8_9BACT|nr:alpha/beta fold hydrolase [Acidisarcina polymorpha]AXC12499.1 Hydrolase, alpha/beta fold family functionally coupled to Phosphoribulokinase [Acidisarcina polymorpha]
MADLLASSPGIPVGAFQPRRILRNGHVMTITGNYIPRQHQLPPGEPWFVEVEPASEERRSTVVRCDCDWQAKEVRRERLTLVLVHGLEGSSRSQYILGTASRAWAAGCNVVRMNMRSCGGTDELSPGIYHSGRSEDVAAVVDGLVREHGLQSVALVGYSMGGNLVLKYTGEAGTAAPAQLRAAVGISPLMDLAASSKALHELRNRVYEWKFLHNMLRRFRKKVALFPELYSEEGLERIRSMRDFDQNVVARYGGFADADDYYQSVASSRVADRFAVPTLIIHALDDPFIRMLASTRETLLGNELVTFVETQYGGHCAFLSPDSGSDRHWAEKTLVQWLLALDDPSRGDNATAVANELASGRQSGQ